MKFSTSFLLFLCLLLGNGLFAQAGSIDWPTACPTNPCMGTAAVGNGLTVTYNRFYVGTGGPTERVIEFVGDANRTAILQQSPSPAGTRGLVIVQDFDFPGPIAAQGNTFQFTFSSPLEGLSFPIIGLTSPVISCTRDLSGSSYNDQVIVTGLDANGATVNATLTEVERGVWSANNGYTRVGNGSGDFPRYQQEAWIVNGNTAYSTAGYASDFPTANGLPTLAGNGTTNLDVRASFPVPVTQVSVQYNNFTGGQYGRENVNDTCNGIAGNRNLAAQGVLLGNFSYTNISVTDCANPPGITLNPTSTSVLVGQPLTINYGIAGGYNGFVSGGNGTISQPFISGASGSFTYTPTASEANSTVTLIGFISDPDGAGPCEFARSDVSFNVTAPVEDCCNGIDDDGDNLIDEADNDCPSLGIRTATTSPTSVISTTITTASSMKTRGARNRLCPELAPSNYAIRSRQATTVCSTSGTMAFRFGARRLSQRRTVPTPRMYLSPPTSYRLTATIIPVRHYWVPWVMLQPSVAENS